MNRSQIVFLLFCVVGLLPLGVQAQEGQVDSVKDASPAAPQGEELTLEQKASRIMAFRLFSQMKRQGAEFDTEQLIVGLKLAMEDKELGMSDEEVGSVLQAFNEEMIRRLMEKREAISEENLSAAEKFFAENKAKEGVVVLESGIQYKTLKEGDGASPEVTDNVQVHYAGRLLDGTEFDASPEGETVRFPVGGVIRGMTEILQKMKVGQKVEVYIPSELAYGAQGPLDRTGRPRMDSEIGPNAALIFVLELVGIDK